MPFRRAYVLVLLAIGFVSTASTCATGTRPPPPVDLDLRDRARFVPGGRATVEILPGNASRRRGSMLDLVTGEGTLAGTEATGRSARVATPTVAIVAELAALSGHGGEPIPAGREVDLDVSFPGPGVAWTDVDSLQGFLGARSGVRFIDRISIEGILGVGLDSTQIRLQSGSVRTQDHGRRAGIVFGGRVSVRPVPLFDLYVQGFALRTSRSDTANLEAGGVLNLSRNLGLYAGYRRWVYDENEVKGRSDAQFDFDGPTLGLSLTF